METGLIFALKTIVGMVGFTIGVLLGSLIGARLLQLAARWLHFGQIEYGKAFRCALLSNFIVAVFNFSIGVNHGLTVASFGQLSAEHASPPIGQRRYRSVGELHVQRAIEQRSQLRDLMLSYTPTFLLFSTVFGVLITAAIFRRVIPNQGDDTRITFSDALVLTSFYYSLAVVCLVLLGLFVYCVIVGLLSMAAW